MVMGSVLRLEVHDYEGPTRWRWVLTDASGAFIADHQVRIDEGSWQYEAFTDLEYYISSYAAPDRYAEDEARIVAEVGKWLGAVVFGPVAESLAQAARRTPVTVRVVVPDGANALLFLPFELAYAVGGPLAVQDVTLVMEAAGGGSASDSVPVGSRLRVLGLFSLPEGGRALNLRRERHALVRLVSRIAARGKAVEAVVLQYGVTRERLRSVLEEAAGWDVIHISGHGAPGKLLLETASGGPDKVTSAELADMLVPARERVKLVTVSACWSAAVTIAEQRRLLGLPVLVDPSPGRDSHETTAPGSFARELNERLGCAVLAMRYPVGDGFAIGLSEKLYELLVDKGQPLARAVGMTVKELTAEDRFRALSVATPALFGMGAAELTLAAPTRTGPPSYGTGELKMAGFPLQAERFVGRTGVMARSSAALAEDSGVSGVLLHGMPGGGKSACAIELAYTHEHAFDRLVWYKAPDEGMEISGALTDFALALERYLEDFQMVHLVSDAEKLAGFLPRLTELMERGRLLLVIDNGESLLTDSGQWRDERWGQVIGALTAHRGLGRVIVTSRRVPANTPGVIASGASAESPGALRESVDALSADEALLLASELPHLRGLINGDLPGIDRNTAQALAVGMLRIAQGHPKLIELANGQAAHPERLAGFVAAGDQAWQDQGGIPDGFFTTGEAAAEPDDYLHILAAWTNAVTDGLAPAERDLFWVLCCMEEADREPGILAALWDGLWKQLGRDGQPPALDQALDTIADRGLMARTTGTEGDERYAIHPGVSAAGRARAGESFQDTVDAAAAFFWRTGLEYASSEASQGDVNTRLIVRAGFRAAPYLIRQEQWEQAAAMLELAFNRDPSRASATAMQPLVRKIAGNLDSAGLFLATVIEVTDPAAAEEQVRGYLAAAVARGDHRAAMIASGRLAYRNLRSGRSAEALDFADQALSHAGRAGIGPWTMLGAEVQRLQMLSETQDAGRVVPEVRRLRDLMDAAEASPGDNEAARSWDVREALLNIDRSVRIALGEWDEALAVNAEIIASMRARHAPASQIAVASMNDYGPLLGRGEARQARDVLLGCRQAFRDANDLGMLAISSGALADVEEKLGHVDNAIKLAYDALRYGYAAGDCGAARDVYHNLGNYLIKHANRPVPALACHLCAALIKTLSGAGDIESSLRAAAVDLYVSGGAIEPPTGIADLNSKTGDIPGTDPAALIAGLSPTPEAAEQALQDLITRARELAGALSEDAAP
jgi:tetratricopeptide (TPR) repeat protein